MLPDGATPADGSLLLIEEPPDGSEAVLFW